MSYAKQLGQHLQKRAFLDQVGEGLVKLLNKASPSTKPGLSLATSKIAPRMTAMAAKYGPQSVEQLQKAPNSFTKRLLSRLEQSGPPSGAADLSAGRAAKLEAVAGKARKARMTAIGAGSLGAAGGLAATQLAGSKRESPELMLR